MTWSTLDRGDPRKLEVADEARRSLMPKIDMTDIDRFECSG
jgi:hypothetical protein